MTFSFDSAQTAQLVIALAAFVAGLIVARLLSPARRRLALADTDRARLRAEIDARDARLRELEREVASSRDQVRPLSDEVDRLRRQIAARRDPPVPVADPPAPAAAAGSPADPMPAFLDAPRGAPDDLMQLKGVGARFAGRLNDIGVFHIAQIAAWTPEEARAADLKLDPFRGRIERDRLIEQARLLAAGRTTEYEARFGRIGGDGSL